MATPFLGCKISLISKSEIRYEGILYTIDPKESTIALAKVKSFGTEDRPAERKVAARDEVFEYIIFRASDIKDLIVDDPPAGTVAPGFIDPAIIQAHSTSNATTGSTTYPPIYPIANTANATSTHTTSGLQSAFHLHMDQFTNLTSGSNQATSNHSRSGNSTPTGKSARTKSPHGQASSGRQTPKNNQYVNQRGDGNQRIQNRRLINAPRLRSGGQQQQQQNYNRQNYGVQNRGGFNNRGANNRYGNTWGIHVGQRREPFRSRQPQQARSTSRNRKNKPPAKQTKDQLEEFDFDKANEEFEKLAHQVNNIKLNDDGKKDENLEDGELTDDLLKDENQTQEACYDKAKSFFDKISCEAIERNKGTVQKVDWKQERKVNAETFGLPQNNFRRGFRGRGYGYGAGPGNRQGGFRGHNRSNFTGGQRNSQNVSQGGGDRRSTFSQRNTRN